MASDRATCQDAASTPDQIVCSSSEALASRAVDPLVVAYRANPDLLAALMANKADRESVVFLLRRAGDEGYFEQVEGESAAGLLDPLSALSPREREVHDLVCEGLTNGEIAKLLYLSEATVKQHVQHVFEKLEMRSRAAVILNGARRLGRIDLTGDK